MFGEPAVSHPKAALQDSQHKAADQMYPGGFTCQLGFWNIPQLPENPAGGWKCVCNPEEQGPISSWAAHNGTGRTTERGAGAIEKAKGLDRQNGIIQSRIRAEHGGAVALGAGTKPQCGLEQPVEQSTEGM